MLELQNVSCKLFQAALRVSGIGRTRTPSDTMFRITGVTAQLSGRLTLLALNVVDLLVVKCNL